MAVSGRGSAVPCLRNSLHRPLLEFWSSKPSTRSSAGPCTLQSCARSCNCLHLAFHHQPSRTTGPCQAGTPSKPTSESVAGSKPCLSDHIYTPGVPSIVAASLPTLHHLGYLELCGQTRNLGERVPRLC